MIEEEEIKKIFKRIKTLHPLWVDGDNGYKERLEDSLKGDFKKLDDFGVARHFSEALLFFGKEFVYSVVKDSKDRKEALPEDAAAIFGGEVKEMDSQDRRAAHIAAKRGIKNYKVIVEADGKVGIVSMDKKRELEPDPVVKQKTML